MISLRPVIFNPKDAIKEAEYYTSLSKEEKKIYKKLPKEEQIKAFQEYYINKNSDTKINIDEYNNQVTEIFEHLKNIGVTDLFGTKKEVKTLVTLLKDDEKVLYATSGLVDGNTYLIVCTDLRLLFLDKGMVYGLKKFDFPFNKINSISYKVGVLFGEIEVHHGSSYINIKNITKNTVEKMSDTIQNQISKYEQHNNKSFSKSNFSVADEILKFKQLLDAGIITQEEFDKKKSELI